MSAQEIIDDYREIRVFLKATLQHAKSSLTVASWTGVPKQS